MDDAITKLADLKPAVDGCTRCPLYKDATQGVAGEGPRGSKIMLVGEQPGDREDLEGRPFVGPAGRILDAAMEEAGLDRKRVYITNAVKHFKFEQRGNRRLHNRPDAYEIERCKWWLDFEKRLLKPKAIVALGATAARSLTGRAMTISSARGKITEMEDCGALIVTVHPSYLLRIRDRADAAAEKKKFIRDLSLAARFLEEARG